MEDGGVLDPGSSARELDGARPLSLAAGDFDEDGIPDLAVGFATRQGGAVALHPGNADSVYPNAPEARARRARGEGRDTPFLAPRRLTRLAFQPDVLGAGDFDADGHLDLVASVAGGERLEWLRGDGAGRLAASQAIALPGALRALAVEDVNRADGLDDVVVALAGRDGARVLVFEGPRGAFRADPEVIEVSAPADALALGDIDGDHRADIAVALGDALAIVHGRDRKLSLGEAQRASVAPPRLTRSPLGFVARSLAVGRFSAASLAGDAPPEIAALSASGGVHLLRHDARSAGWLASAARPGARSPEPSVGPRLVTARPSSLALDHVAVLDAGAAALHLVALDGEVAASTESVATAGAPTAVLPMRLNRDALSDLVVLSSNDPAPRVLLSAPAHTFTVDSTANDDDANAADALCQTASGSCTLRAAVTQANASAGADLIEFAIPGAGVQNIQAADLVSTEAVTIDGTTQVGAGGEPLVRVSRGAMPGIEGLVLNGGSSVVRGLLMNGSYESTIEINSSSNIIEGNWLGTSSSGTAAGPGGAFGVDVKSGSVNVVGGTTAAARNVIAGNVQSEVQIEDNGPGTRVLGNFVGVGADGTTPLGTALVCIGVDALSVVGGTTAGAGNVVASCSGENVGFHGVPANASSVIGNRIGTDVTGTRALGGAIGVSLASDDVTVGGTYPSARNVISGNVGEGIRAYPFSSGNLIQGNFIGTAADGTTFLGNGAHGLRFDPAFSSATVGGVTEGADNVIAFNGGAGIRDFGTTLGVVVALNSIHSNGSLGIDIEPAGGGNVGVPILTGATSVSVKGTIDAEANVPYRIEIYSSPSCDSSGFGEGRTLRGFTTVQSPVDASPFQWNLALGAPIPAGQAITATVADETRTSEFSACLTVASGSTVELESPSDPIHVGDTVSLVGGGFTPGTVLKVFLGTASGPVDVLPNGLVPDSVTATTWEATLPFPWPVAAPNDIALGNGFVSLQLVRTDAGFDTSNVVGAVLLGNPVIPVPSITALDGLALSATSSDPAIKTANVESVLGLGDATTIGGEGFASPVVNVFTAAGNIGPIVPTGFTATSIDYELPADAPVGPGSVQVVNTTDFRVSNAVSVLIGEPVTVTSVSVNGGTITVDGTGFNPLTVINLFAASGGLPVNAGGLDGGGDPVIPLTIVDEHQFTFTRPAGLDAGPAFVEAINPPFIPYTSSGAGAGGAFLLP